MIITQAYVREHLPEIKAEYHKYQRGRLLLVAGSFGMAGAAILAAKAALKSGVGYLNLAVTKDIYPMAQVAVPEAVFVVYESAKDLIPYIEKADAVAVGPGLSFMAAEVLSVLSAFPEKKILLDADGLNALSKWGDLSKGDPSCEPFRNLCLTPHEGEAARLLGRDASQAKREEGFSSEQRGNKGCAQSITEAQEEHASKVTEDLEDYVQIVSGSRETRAKEISLRYHATVLLKGPNTIITDGVSIAVNPTGGPHLATAGSGDVLTGICGALLAQGATPFGALTMGAYIHGKSGDLAASLVGVRSCRPTDVIAAISTVLRQIEAHTEGGDGE